MDDLIVIILTLIIAGVGALSQLKKKKQAAVPVEDNEQETPDSLWDLMQGESNMSQPVNDQRYGEPEYEQYEEPNLTTKEVKFDPQNEGEFILKKNSQRNVKETKLKSKVKKDFSLRKAVIYSEILNRKYS